MFFSISLSLFKTKVSLLFFQRHLATAKDQDPRRVYADPEQEEVRRDAEVQKQTQDGSLQDTLLHFFLEDIS